MLGNMFTWQYTTSDLMSFVHRYSCISFWFSHFALLWIWYFVDCVSLCNHKNITNLTHFALSQSLNVFWSSTFFGRLASILLLRMDSRRPKHVEDWSTLSDCEGAKCVGLVMFLWLYFVLALFCFSFFWLLEGKFHFGAKRFVFAYGTLLQLI